MATDVKRTQRDLVEREPKVAALHAEHRAWQSEDNMWRDDVRAWEDEVVTAKGQVDLLKITLVEHERAMAKHAAAVRLYEQEAAAHEKVLARFELGGDATNLAELEPVHVRAREAHERLRTAHERIKKLHHTLLARLSLVVKAAEQAM